MALSRPQRDEFGDLMEDPHLEPFLSRENTRRPSRDHANDATAYRDNVLNEDNISSEGAITGIENVSSVSSLTEHQDPNHAPPVQADKKTAIDSTRNYEPSPPAYEGDVWKPGFWRQFPWTGVAALIASILFIVASIIVLGVSDGQPNDWRISPTVYIAIFMTITNLLASYAFKSAAKLSWWRIAIRGGTLRELNNVWAHGDGLFSALRASSATFNLVTLSSIAVTLMAVDQPLLQRASTIRSVVKVEAVNVTATIAPEIPWGYTGYSDGRLSDESVIEQLMTRPMINAFNDFNSKAKMTSGFEGCKGTCTGYVEAGGLAAKCNATTGDVNYGLYLAFNDADISPFSVSFGRVDEKNFGNGTILPSYLTMSVVYTSNTNSTCSGTLVKRSCMLVPATLRYPVSITNNTLTLGNVLTNGSVTAFQPGPPASLSIDGNNEYHMFTLSGIHIAATNLFASNATYTGDNGAAGVAPSLPDTLSNQFLTSSDNNAPITNMTMLAPSDSCNLNWTDPTSTVLSSLNEIAFRLSLSAVTFPYRNTTSPPQAQLVSMTQTSTINVYQTSLKFLICGALIPFLCVLLIFPAFLGWWVVGRSVTMNPLETGKAFDAPILAGPGSNAKDKDLVRILGRNKVRLGEMDGVDGGRRLILANPEEVIPPKEGVAYF